MTKSIHHTEWTHIRQRGGWEPQATGRRAGQREGGAGQKHGRGASSQRAHRRGSARPLEGGCWRRLPSTTTAGSNRTRPLWPPPSYFRGPTIHLLRNEPRGSRARSTRASRATGRGPGVRAARAPSKPRLRMITQGWVPTNPSLGAAPDLSSGASAWWTGWAHMGPVTESASTTRGLRAWPLALLWRRHWWKYFLQGSDHIAFNIKTSKSQLKSFNIYNIKINLTIWHESFINSF